MLANLIAIAGRHSNDSGLPTAVPRLRIWSANAPTEPIPALFEAKFYLLLQGIKYMTFAGKTFVFRAGTCSTASVGLPFVSQVIEASPEVPYLGVELRLDAGVVAGLMMDTPSDVEQPSEAISVGQADERILEPLGRLLSLLDAPADIAVLAPQFERELCYRLLQGPMGAKLRLMGGSSARFGQIRVAAEWICENADQRMHVAQLAESVGMSVTSFHRHFKAVTGHAPLAYQRYIRLLDARRRLASGSSNVTTVAFATGYASASQFSREYKKTFGVPPIIDAGLLRQ
ncbi:MAG: AraC family transcriptional regulator [Rhodanobacter sp.]